MKRRPAALAMAFVLVFSMGFIFSSDDLSAEPAGRIWIVSKDGHGDTSSLSSAIASAKDGDTIRVWEGVFYGHAIIDKELTIIGNGSSNTIIQHSPPIPPPYIVMDIFADNVSIIGVKVVSTTDRFTGIHITNAANCLVHEVEVEANHPMRIERSVNVTVTDSSFISLPNQTTVYAFPGDIDLVRTEEVTMSGNSLSKGLSFSASSDLAEHWDSHDIDDTNTVNGEPVLYRKNLDGDVLQGSSGQLILANCHGATVEDHTADGVYAGVIIGMGANNTLSGGTISSFDYGIMLINTDDNEVRGLDVSGGMTGVYIMGGSGNLLNESHVSGTHRGAYLGHTAQANTLEGNILTLNDYGAYVYGSDHNRIMNNSFLENRYHGLQLDGHRSGPYHSNHTLVQGNVFDGNSVTGMRLSHSNHNLILNNTIKNSDSGILFDHYDQQFNVGWSEHNTVAGNHINNISGRAVFVWGSSHNVFCSNKVSDNRDGIVMDSASGYGSQNNTVQNNEFRNSGHSAIHPEFNAAVQIYFDSKDIVIIGNSFHEDSNAIRMRGAEGILIVGNTITHAQTGIDIRTDSGNVTIRDNAMVGAGKTGTGISVGGFGDNTLQSNVINGFRTGVSIHSVDGNVIEDNFMNGSRHTLRVSTTDDNRFLGNTFSYSEFHGAELTSSSGNIFEGNTFSDNGRYGISISGGSDNEVIGNEFHRNNQSGWSGGQHIRGTGVFASETNRLTLSFNNMSDNVRSIRVEGSESIIVSDNRMNSSTSGIGIIDCVDAAVSDNRLESIYQAIEVAGSADVRLNGNTINGSYYGISIRTSELIDIGRNELHGSAWHAINLERCESAIIHNNSISHTAQTAISIEFDCSGVEVNDNTVIATGGHGVMLFESSDVKVNRNILTGGADADVALSSAHEVTMRDNTMDWGIGILEGFSTASLSSNDIDESNTARGRPVVYWVGQSDAAVPTGASQVILVSCERVTVQGANLSDVHRGIMIADSASITIAENHISGNLEDGIYLYLTEESLVTNNTITANTYSGILIDGSSGNEISYNLISETGKEGGYGCGVMMQSRGTPQPTGNSIFRNDITDNKYGIYVQEGRDNSIYNNNLIGNDNNAVDYGGSSWNAEYPVGGNYWSDYDGEDADKDGIGDEPYDIWHGSQDALPLMQPWFLDEEPPKADAGPESEAYRGLETSFDGSGSTDNVGIVNYTWAFNDGIGEVVLHGVSQQHIFNVVGEYTVTLTVKDAAGNSDTDSTTVTVLPSWAPVFGPPPVEGQEAWHYEHVVTANESVSWEIAHNLPASLTVTSNDTSFTVEGVTELGDRGSYWINVTATSEAGKLSTTHNWTLNLGPAWAPTFGPPPPDALEAVYYEHVITVNESIMGVIAHWNFPQSLEMDIDFDNATFTISGTPQAGDAGIYMMNFTVWSMEGKLDAFEEWNLTILPGWAPVFGPPPVEGQEAWHYEHVVTANESVSWEIAHNLPPSLTITSDDISFTVEGVTELGDRGSYWINVTATSEAGRLSTNHNWTLELGMAWAPQFQSEPPTAPHGGFLAGQTYIYILKLNETADISMDTDAGFLVLLDEGVVIGNMEGGVHNINISAFSPTGKLVSWQNYTLTVASYVLINGTVLDGEGNPVAGVGIWVGGVLMCSTDEDGGFVFSVREGEHSVLVAGDGFEPQTIELSAHGSEPLSLEAMTLMAIPLGDDLDLEDDICMGVLALMAAWMLTLPFMLTKVSRGAAGRRPPR